MKTKQKSFILYDDDLECVQHLTTEQAGQLLKAIVNLRSTGEVPDFGDDTALKILFHQIAIHIAINEEKYRQSCERNAQAARKRWKDNTKQNNAYASECMRTHANGCYNDNDNDNDNDIDIDIDIDNVNDIDIENNASALTSGSGAETPRITVDDILSKYRKIIAERASQ